MSVDMAYALLDEGPVAMTWHEMERALRYAEARGLLDHVVTAIPIWPSVPRCHLLWGHTGAVQSEGWRDYLRLALLAGYYAIAPIDHEGRGPFAEGDHWVLLRGVRSGWEPVGTAPGALILRTEVLVSSSSAGGSETWIEAERFLRDHGGFTVMLARPTAGPP